MYQFNLFRNNFGFQVKIGCCTVDILKHLSGEEMSRHSMDGTPSDRLSRLDSHILSQRRYLLISYLC